jgi:hypothetical protein
LTAGELTGGFMDVSPRRGIIRPAAADIWLAE